MLNSCSGALYCCARPQLLWRQRGRGRRPPWPPNGALVSRARPNRVCWPTGRPALLIDVWRAGGRAEGKLQCPASGKLRALAIDIVAARRCHRQSRVARALVSQAELGGHKFDYRSVSNLSTLRAGRPTKRLVSRSQQTLSARAFPSAGCSLSPLCWANTAVSTAVARVSAAKAPSLIQLE